MFDCSQYQSSFHCYKVMITKYLSGVPSTIAIIMLSLIAQTFNYERLDVEEIAFRVKAHSSMKSKDTNTISNGSSLRFLCEMLHSALNSNPSRHYVLLLHRTDDLLINDLELLRNAVRNVMNPQRHARVAQTRAYVTCKRNYETEVALQ